MKKQLLSFLVLSVLGINTIFGQYQISATGANDMRLRTNNLDRINILTNGNVGIGTNLPDTKLHIQDGSEGIVTSSSASMVMLENTRTRSALSHNGIGVSIISKPCRRCRNQKRILLFK